MWDTADVSEHGSKLSTLHHHKKYVDHGPWRHNHGREK